MSLQPQQIADLVKDCTNKLQTKRHVDVSMPLRSYVAYNLLKYAKVIDGGGMDPYRWLVNLDFTNTGGPFGMYQEMDYSFADSMEQAELYSKRFAANAVYDVDEVLFNESRSSDDVVSTQIMDFVDKKETDGLKSIYATLENQFHGTPTDSTDLESMNGLLYHLDYNSSLGYNAANPTGFTTYQGLTRTNRQNQWGNYTGSFSDISKDDFCDKLDDCMEYTSWEIPVDVPELVNMRNLRFLSVYALEKKIKRLSEQQNDQLGFDIDPAYKKASYRRIPLDTSPKLEAQVTAGDIPGNPFLGIDYASFFVLSPDNLAIVRDADDQHLPNKPTVYPIHFFLRANLGCWSPRSNFELHEV